MASSGNWPNPAEAPAMGDLTRCVHCGLCLNSCPTYVVTGLEAESPRGRIYLARAIAEERIELSDAVQGHWDLCLQCRACEAVCPSGVAYGRIMEHARAQEVPGTGSRRRARRALLRQVVARPRVLAAAMAPARWWASSPLGSFGRRVAGRWTGRLGLALRQLPRGQGSPLRAGTALPQPDRPTGNALLFTGCVMSELFGEVHRSTARVVARAGIAAEAPAEQTCCGALHAHDGDLEFARRLARRNISAFERTPEVPIIVNSAGCGAAMKEYPDLLAGDSHFAGRARLFASRVRDVTEYLAGIDLRRGAFQATVTYQDPCHLAHAQRIREQPRDLLRAIEGCNLVETAGSDLCCGAAGIYSLVQPEMSAQLRARKAEQFRLHRPEIIATANPGCQMQYEAAVREAGIDARVMHVVEVLDEAQRRAEASALEPG